MVRDEPCGIAPETGGADETALRREGEWIAAPRTGRKRRKPLQAFVEPSPVPAERVVVSRGFLFSVVGKRKKMWYTVFQFSHAKRCTVTRAKRRYVS